MAIRPTDSAELADAIRDARAHGRRLAIRGGGSKTAIGAPATDAEALDLRAFAGVIDYDPAELVLTVGTGTPLAEIEALVAGEGQMLAFEPFDHGPLFGAEAGRATIGGVVAAGVAGSQRLTQGGARDHLLGFRAVAGSGEALIGGAKVVKNVTGYDLPKLMAGSWGRLAALTEITLKVLPSPREQVTRVLHGLDIDAAVAAMATALGSQADVAAAAYLPAVADEQMSVTAFRIQGFGPSVTARCAMLERKLDAFGALQPGDAALWRDLATLAPLEGDAPLWRINVPPRGACTVTLADWPDGTRWLLDWAGGLVWLTTGADAETVRTVATRAGGHAMLVRADTATRTGVAAFHPASPGVAALEYRVRRAFDPDGVFETGRFGNAGA